MKTYKIYGNCRAYFKAYVNAKNKKEARNSIDCLSGTFPIGNRIINYIYEEV